MKFTRYALLAAVALSMLAATIVKKVSEFPSVTTPGTNDLFLLASGATNKNISYADLKTSINATNVIGSGTANTLAIWSGTNLLAYVINGVGILTNDGAGGFGFTTNIAQAITINNFSTTNLTVFNTLTVSNIITTNITVLNSLTTSNLYVVNGKNNTLIVTNYIRLPVTTLTLTDTNASTVDVAAGSAFSLTLTTNAYMAAPTGLPGTNLIQGLQIFVQQDGTGSRTLTWNSAWKFAGGTAPTMTTTTNAVDVFTFASSPFDSTVLYGVPAQDIR